MDADAVRRDQPGHLAVEAGGGHQDPPGHHAVREHLAVGVDVGEERLQDADALPHAALDEVPLHRVDHPRHEIQRERPLVTTQVEGDAAVGEHPRQLIGAEAQLGRIHRLQGADQAVVGRARLPGSREHLVPGLRGLIPVEDVRHDLTVLSGCSAFVTGHDRSVSPAFPAEPLFDQHHYGK